jgi:hypothetical protein
MMHMHVSVSDHRPSTIPTSLADNVHTFGVERVSCPNHGSDIQIVLPILDCDMERMTTHVEISDNRLVRPIAIAIADIATITMFEQFAIKSNVFGPRQGVRTYADLSIFTLDELAVVGIMIHEHSPIEESGPARIVEKETSKGSSCALAI